jgi:hypothetical protein
LVPRTISFLVTPSAIGGIDVTVGSPTTWNTPAEVDTPPESQLVTVTSRGPSTALDATVSLTYITLPSAELTLSTLTPDPEIATAGSLDLHTSKFEPVTRTV